MFFKNCFPYSQFVLINSKIWIHSFIKLHAGSVTHVISLVAVPSILQSRHVSVDTRWWAFIYQKFTTDVVCISMYLLFLHILYFIEGNRAWNEIIEPIPPVRNENQMKYICCDRCELQFHIRLCINNLNSSGLFLITTLQSMKSIE